MRGACGPRGRSSSPARAAASQRCIQRAPVGRDTGKKRLIRRLCQPWAERWPTASRVAARSGGPWESARGRGKSQALPDFADRQAIRAGFDQQPEDGQPGFVRQGGKGGEHILCFYNSSILEI